VLVTSESSFVRVPKDSAMGEYVGAGGLHVTPTWVEVHAGEVVGWMPARALVVPGESGPVPGPARTIVGADRKGEAADALLAHLADAPDFRTSDDPFVPRPRLKGLPEAGSDLAVLDPAAHAAAEEARAAAAAPGPAASSARRSVDMLRQLGVRGADDPNMAVMAEFSAITADSSSSTCPTPADERRLGRDLLARALDGARVIPEDHPASCYVRWIGMRLVAAGTAPYPSIGADFVVLDANAPRSEAIPGGPVLVTTGMLRTLASEAELAAVLARAVAHCEERQGLRHAVEGGVLRSYSRIDRLSPMAAGQQSRLLQGAGVDPAKASAAAQAMAKDFAAQALASTISAFPGLCSSVTAPGACWSIGEFPTDVAVLVRATELLRLAGFDPSAIEGAYARLGSAGPVSASREAQIRADVLKEAVRHSMMAERPAGGVGGPAAGDRWSRLLRELSAL
jgi:hypothetical protein